MRPDPIRSPLPSPMHIDRTTAAAQPALPKKVAFTDEDEKPANAQQPAKEKGPDDLPDKVAAWFEKSDANKDEQLTVEEATEYIVEWINEEYGIVITEGRENAMVKNIFNEIDVNHDGFIDKKELENHMRETQIAR